MRGGKELLPLGGCRSPSCFPFQVWRRSWEKTSNPEKSPESRLLQGTGKSYSCSKALGDDGGKGTPHIRLPAPGRVPAGPGGGRFGPSYVCRPEALLFLLQDQKDLDIDSGPVQPNQKHPHVPLLSLVRVTAGCRLLQQDHGRDRTSRLITSPVCLCDCSDTLAQGSFCAGASFCASALHGL